MITQTTHFVFQKLFQEINLIIFVYMCVSTYVYMYKHAHIYNRVCVIGRVVYSEGVRGTFTGRYIS